MSLVELLKKYGDKTDKNSHHSYDRFYEPFLRHQKLTAKNVIEIGVSYFGGGGVAAFRDYFENAMVYGVDIDYDRCDKVKNVTYFEGDAYSTSFMDATLPVCEWDVVLDDGPHTPASQLRTLNYFYDKLSPQGVIIVEDVVPSSFDYIYTNFKGYTSDLSVIDRTRCPRDPFHENGVMFCDEYLLVCMR